MPKSAIYFHLYGIILTKMRTCMTLLLEKWSAIWIAKKMAYASHYLINEFTEPGA